MSAIGRIFDPLWALIGRNMYLACAIFYAICGMGILLHRPMVILVAGLIASAIVMMKSEEKAPEAPHVQLPIPDAVISPAV